MSSLYIDTHKKTGSVDSLSKARDRKETPLQILSNMNLSSTPFMVII